MGRRAGILAIGLSAVVGVQLATAAATQEIETELHNLEITPRDTQPPTAKYAGRVDSPRSRCVRGREVIVRHESEPPFTIGIDDANSDGEFRIVGSLPPGGEKVSFTATERDISTPRRDRVCREERKVIKLRPDFPNK